MVWVWLVLALSVTLGVGYVMGRRRRARVGSIRSARDINRSVYEVVRVVGAARCDRFPRQTVHPRHDRLYD
jgi:hypothetical protein